MKVTILPGPPPNAEDLARAHERFDLLRTELTRVRAAAVAWRNGLAGLLAALAGFGLIRGRNDIGEVAAPWHVVVGAMLLASLAVGATGAYWLLRAAHGRPALTPVGSVLNGPAAEHVTAVAALRDLSRGIVGVQLCAALLVGAVGITWYGPARSEPRLRITVPGATVCGSVVRVAAGRAVLATDAGQVEVAFADALAVQPVAKCS